MKPILILLLSSLTVFGEEGWHMAMSNTVSGPVSVVHIAANGHIDKELTVVHPEMGQSVTITNTLYALSSGTNLTYSKSSNECVVWLESPMTVPIHDYHANGWETESLWNSYKYTDPKIQIGLRPDGVVIWRKRPEVQK